MQYLTTRAIIELRGEERVSFLQTLVSNDVTKATQSVLVYAALLTPQGKWQHDMLVMAQDDALLLLVHADELAALVQKLTLYKLRSDVALRVPEEQLAVLHDGTQGVADPRAVGMGCWEIMSKDALPELVSDAEYTQHRLHCAVPDSGVDMVESTLAMEAGLEALHGVDFAKGCYVGQEVTTRSKFRGKVRKQLAVLAHDGVALPAGAEIMADGKKVGDVRSVGNGLLMGMVRLDAADKELKVQDVLVTLVQWAGGATQ